MTFSRNPADNPNNGGVSDYLIDLADLFRVGNQMVVLAPGWPKTLAKETETMLGHAVYCGAGNCDHDVDTVLQWAMNRARGKNPDPADLPDWLPVELVDTYVSARSVGSSPALAATIVQAILSPAEAAA